MRSQEYSKARRKSTRMCDYLRAISERSPAVECVLQTGAERTCFATCGLAGLLSTMTFPCRFSGKEVADRSGWSDYLKPSPRPNLIGPRRMTTSTRRGGTHNPRCHLTAAFIPACRPKTEPDMRSAPPGKLKQNRPPTSSPAAQRPGMGS
jgi:hypothetical protein